MHNTHCMHSTYRMMQDDMHCVFSVVVNILFLMLSQPSLPSFLPLNSWGWVCFFGLVSSFRHVHYFLTEPSCAQASIG
jgi:hypothetical protein